MSTHKKDVNDKASSIGHKVINSLGASRDIKGNVGMTPFNLSEDMDSSLTSLECSVSDWDDSDPKILGSLASRLFIVDEILKVTQEDVPFQERSENLLQLAMSKLEDDFRIILVRNSLPLDFEWAYKFVEGKEECLVSEGDGSLIHQDAIDDLKAIAERMLRAGYEKECCRVYSSVRRDAYDGYFSILNVDKLGIEEVQKIEGDSWDTKANNWIKAVKVVIKFILRTEKRICEEIFVGSESITDVFYDEIAKFCVMQLMTFSEGVSIGERSSEKLFRMLGMHDALVGLLPDLQAIFSDERRKFVFEDVQGIITSLGIAAKATLVKFENAIQNEKSQTAIPGGDIHPLTRYVMNYAMLLTDYSESVDLLLRNESGDSNDSNGHGIDSVSCFSKRLTLFISCLESNLEEKSKFYPHKGLQFIFLMNNVLYIVQKVKVSEGFRKILGDGWVRRRQVQIRQYSTGYLRASWSKVLSCLKDEGIWGGGNSSNVSKVALKERFKSFNLCFEELYRNETAWRVHDPQLREELRISISEKILPAYRSFLGRFRSHIESGKHSGKYIKYMPEDLENYLLDLFEGNLVVMHHLKKKSG